MATWALAQAIADLSGRLPDLHCLGQCTRIFDLDPMVCRIYGLTKRLACPYGCEPDRWLTDAEADTLLKADEILRGHR
jgi:hypothetical protein